MSIARYFAKPAKTTAAYPSTSTTVFTVSGGYPVGQLDVFLNGVRLIAGDDYTATNGTTFTLTSAAISGDVVQYTVYPTSPLTYLSTGGGSVTGDVSLAYTAPLLQFSNTTYSQNWRVGSSGSSSFILNDQTNSKTPFVVAANAPDNSLAISAAGLITLANGQINFPATANPSTNANTLDEYEEGTWTPAFSGATTNPTVTYTAARSGFYVKIGRTVFIQGRITISATSGGSGNLRISGLPFTVNSTTPGAIAIGWRNSWTTQGPTQIYPEAGTTVMSLVYLTATASTATTTANLAATSDIIFAGTYFTDA